jgi:NCAIR mutase (PurE)-related protein
MAADLVPDHARAARIGLPEAVFCEGKSDAQLAAIIAAAPGPLLLTRLDAARLAGIAGADALDHDPLSRTGFLGSVPEPAGAARVAVVTAGTSDVAVAAEAERTLRFHGEASARFADIGVAGLWRLLERRDALAAYPVVIAVAGMEGALFSVLGGLVPGLLIAVPSAVGYGVGRGGRTALRAALSSCAPGVVVVNIDNGYGAACAALRALRANG